jgi:DNA polymerase III epsilon subunit-like protein
MSTAVDRQDAAGTAGMLGMIVNKLLRVMRRRFNCFPDNYLVIDLETTGLSRQEDLIGQIGYCVVQNRRPVKTYSAVLNWFRHADVDKPWLLNRLQSTKYQVEHDKATGRRNSRTYNLSPEFLLNHGGDPVAALALCHNLLVETV